MPYNFAADSLQAKCYLGWKSDVLRFWDPLWRSISFESCQYYPHCSLCICCQWLVWTTHWHTGNTLSENGEVDERRTHIVTVD